MSGTEFAALPPTELELLFDIARTLDKYVELRTALGPVLSILEVRRGLKHGMVTLLDRATGLLRIEEAYGLTEEEKDRGVYRLGEGLVGKVFETGSAITVADLSKEPRFLNRAKNRRKADMTGMAYICVPVRSGGTVIGTLSAERRSGADAEQQLAEDRSLLEKVALIIADSAKLRERIMEGQMGLTGPARPGKGLPGKGTPGTEPSAGESAAFSGRIASGSAIIGTSSALRDVYDMLVQVATSDATVLVTGESGTGKELIAAEIYRLSRRNSGPFIKVNCAALPESIIESELFGHEKGAFTGAMKERKGRFEMAHKGTIFLDEIGELPPQIQVKLLRVLQEMEIERVGGSETIKVDVRLVAATNKNLAEELRAGRFREDLYYRLNVFPLHVPPLRERKADIMLLADYFTEKYAAKNGKLIKRISTPAIDLLTAYSWPGNVRELENCIERAVILSSDHVIHSYNLPPSLQSPKSTHTETTATLEAALSRLEKEMIVEALKITEGNLTAAAQRLAITDRQMGLRIARYGINWRTYRKQRPSAQS